MIAKEIIATHLTTNVLGRNLEYIKKLDSTNTAIWRKLITSDLTEGHVIITDNQITGKGRRGNGWISHSGESLTFSILLTPKINIKKLSLISILAAVSVVNGINDSVKINAKLKWPNDIILNNKKMGGILIESKIIKKQPYVVLGIGINVNQVSMPTSITKTSTSIRINNFKVNSIELLCASILNQLELLYSLSEEKWINQWNDNCNHQNLGVQFHDKNKLQKGIFVGISEVGEALIKMDNNIKIFTSEIIELS